MTCRPLCTGPRMVRLALDNVQCVENSKAEVFLLPVKVTLGEEL